MSHSQSDRRFVVRALAGAIAAAASGVAPAAEFMVTTTAATGAGSLYQSINNANVTPGADTIRFAVTGNINTTSQALPIISDQLTITGPGYQSLSVSGGSTQIFRVDLWEAGDVSISGLSLTNSTGGVVGAYGAATLHVENVVISGNTGSTSLLDIAEGGDLELANVLIANNSLSASASAVYLSSGTAGSTISSTTIADNTFAGSGSPLRLNYATATLTDTAISANTTQLGAGAIAAANSTLTVRESLISDNTTDWDGGGIAFVNGSDLVVENSAFDGNYSATKGGAIHVQGVGVTTISGSSFSNNQGSVDPTYGGGAVNVEGASDGALTITDCLFAGNETPGKGARFKPLAWPTLP